MHNSTETRIAELESLLVETERQLIALHRGEMVASPPPPPSISAPPPPPASAPPRAPQSQWPPGSSPESSGSPANEESFFGAEMVLRFAGIAMVIASAIFFVSTAISRGWIGPAAQLTLASLASVAMMASSFRFLASRRPWAITMAIGGTTSLFVSGVVGFVGLDLLSFPVAVGWLVVSIAAYLVLSRSMSAESIAIASAPAVVAGVVMLRVGVDFDPSLLAFVGSLYLLGVTAVTHLRGWFWARSLGAIVGAGVAGLGVFAVTNADASTELNLVVLAATVVAILCAGASQAIEFAAADASESPNPVAIIEARVAALIIPWISLLSAAVAIEIGVTSVDFFWVVAILGSLAGVGVFLLRPMTISMRLIHGAAAIGTVAVALVAVTDGPVLLVALLAQASIAGGLAYRFRTIDMTVLASLLGLLVGAITLGEMLQGAFVDGLSVSESLSVLAVVVMSGVVAWVLRRDGYIKDAWIATWLLSLGWASATFRDVPQGQMIVTLVWAAIGVAMVVGGSRLRDSMIVHGGFATLAVTAAKLIFVDLVAVDVLWRAALFFVVGSLFLRLAFMLPQLTAGPARNEHDEDIAGEPTEPPLVDSGFGGR